MANDRISSVSLLRPNNQRLFVAPPSKDWWDPLQDLMDTLVKLPVGWDGYQGKPVRFEIAYFALSMLDQCCSDDCVQPQLVPLANGGLQIEWHFNDKSIELEINAPYDVNCWRGDDDNPAGESFHADREFTQVGQWLNELVPETVRNATSAA